MMIKRLSPFFLLLIAVSVFEAPLVGQGNAEMQVRADSTVEGKVKLRDRIMTKMKEGQARRDRKSKEGRFIILPMAGPAYTPELKFTVAGSVMMSFSTDKSDTTLQRSSSPIVLGVSTSGAYFFGSKVSTFWLHDKMRIYADVGFKKMPDNYFGVGYEEGLNTPRSDTTTKYRKTLVVFNPRIVYQFRENHFIGTVIDFNYVKGAEASQGVAEDPFYIKYNDRPFNSGVGLVYQYDSRDIAVNAWKGWYLEVLATFYGKYLGGDNTYQAYSFDYRNYFRIKRDGRTIATQLKGRFTKGEVHYGQMSFLGTPYDLRGYHEGQYRDDDVFTLITEYRHMFAKKDGSLSDFGGVFWLGVGTLGETIKDFDKWLPNVGVGFRFEVEPRMNVRVDFGFGKETFGFYFNFNEAF